MSTGTKDRVDGMGEKVICNGEAQRTSKLTENGSVSGDNLDHPDNYQVSGNQVCDPLDTRWTKNEETALNSKDPSCNSHSSDNTSSGDETEESDFAANWYVPLPQDPSQSDDEGVEHKEEGQEWSKGASGLTQAQEEEEISEDVEQTVGMPVRDVEPVSRMEDSKSCVDAQE